MLVRAEFPIRRLGLRNLLIAGLIGGGVAVDGLAIPCRVLLW